jgi:hypothetical protein
MSLYCFVAQNNEKATLHAMPIPVKKKSEAVEMFNLFITFSTGVVFSYCGIGFGKVAVTWACAQEPFHRMLRKITCNATHEHRYVISSHIHMCFVLCKRVFKLHWCIRLLPARVICIREDYVAHSSYLRKGDFPGVTKKLAM